MIGGEKAPKVDELLDEEVSLDFLQVVDEEGEAVGDVWLCPRAGPLPWGGAAPAQPQANAASSTSRAPMARAQRRPAVLFRPMEAILAKAISDRL